MAKVQNISERMKAQNQMAWVASFIDYYTEDMKTRLKETTWNNKEHIIRTKLLPYFGKLKLSSITPQQIITWQNKLMLC